MRLIADTVAFTVNEIPSWNPINVCSYHLQEAGATPVQEIAYALSTAIAVLDEVKARGQVAEADFPKVFGRISFFVNAGRPLRRGAREAARDGRAVGGDRARALRRHRAEATCGCATASRSTPSGSPSHSRRTTCQRIVLEALAVTLGRDARARAIQLPAWNEALGLPRPWDQQWSLRIQQILAFETDLLEYPDIFEGSKVMDGLVDELVEGAEEEMTVVEEQGGAVEAVAYMKARLVESHRERIAKIERGEIKVVGQNCFTETEDSPLTAGADGGILTPDPEVERERREALERWKAERDQAAVERALGGARRGRRATSRRTSCRRRSRPRRRARPPASGPAPCARCSATTAPRPASPAPRPAATRSCWPQIRARVDELAERLGHRPRILVGKPGLDGHSNGAEQIAVRARDVGMEVIYQGIRLTPEQIAASARDEDVDVVGLSILSGSHLELIPETVRLLREQEVDAPVVVGGIIPAADAETPARGGRRRASTRPRTSTSTGSWARSSTWSASAPGLPPRPEAVRAAAGPGPGLSPPPIDFPVEGLERWRDPPAADGRGRRRRTSSQRPRTPTCSGSRPCPIPTARTKPANGGGPRRRGSTQAPT